MVPPPICAMRHNPGFGIVGELVQEGRVIGLGCGAGGGADKGLARGKLNAVGRPAIEGPAAAVADGCARRGDEGLGPFNRRDDGRRRRVDVPCRRRRRRPSRLCGPARRPRTTGDRCPKRRSCSRGAVYFNKAGHPPLPTRLMAWLSILKHMHDLSVQVLLGALSRSALLVGGVDDGRRDR